MAHRNQFVRQLGRSSGLSSRSSRARGDPAPTSDETHEAPAWSTAVSNGSRLQVRNIIALRRWPSRTVATEQRRRRRVERRASRPPRLDLASLFWQRIHVALDRSRRRDRFWQRVQLELEKARRHDRRFVLARLRFDLGAHGAKQLGADLPHGLRYEDAVLVADGRPDEVLVLLAEADGAAAGRVLDRLERQHATHRLRVLAVVVFPADGFTRGALVDALYEPGASVAVAGGVRREPACVEPNLVTGV
jgi:hypothetical protein